MTRPTLRPLSELLNADNEAARDEAWDAFMGEYSGLLLRTARRAASTYDDAMDRYTFVLEKLREDEFKRLRRFSARGRGKFTTWLVVVARRLCVDHHRQLHGRPQTNQSSNAGSNAVQEARKNLLELIGNELEPERLEDERSPKPDDHLLAKERREALEAVVAELDLDDQLLLTLRFEDEIPVEKIAPLVGLRSRFQVHRRLRKVLARLREELEKRGVTEP